MIYLLGFICFGFLGFICYDFWELSVWIFLLMPINSTLCYYFWDRLIILKNSKTYFYLFYSLSFNFIIFCNRVASILHHSIISIRDQVIILILHHLYF